MLDAAVLKALGLGAPSNPVPADDSNDYYEVIDPAAVNKAPAIAYIQGNPGETITKKFVVKNYTLVLVDIPPNTLYWKSPKPARLKMAELTRVDPVPEGSVPGLSNDVDWYTVGYVTDPLAIPEAKRYLQKTPGDTSTKNFPDGRTYRIRLVNGVLYWSVPKVVPVVNAGPPVEDNPDFDWLVYETRVNAVDFQKEKVALAYGLFAVPLDYRAEVVAARELPDILVQAFFPGLSAGEVQELSEHSCRWRGGAERPSKFGPNSVAAQSSPRSQLVIHAPRMMVMPYNYFANDESSYAIGTALEQEILPGPAFRLKKFWPLWETASRSSVSQLTATQESDLLRAERLSPQWTYRSRKAPEGGEIPPAYKDKIFKLGGYTNCYSVKTGVRWLGKVPQGSGDAGGGKDVLEVNALLASMRSDWVEYVEATAGKSDFLIVLRELLTVTFPNRYRDKRDGYQIRDLRPLDPAKVYFPPLSIPFGGRQFVEAYNARHPTATLDFEAFWERYYAAAVGKAKAELLLRYGMQLTTPNPQNFLLEFNKDTLEPTGKVVIRDIGDAKIHSEVIGRIGRGQPVIEYELTNPKRPGYLPAQTNNEGRGDDHARHDRFDQYPLNTRTHWHQYSTFKDKYGGKFLPDTMMTTVRWGRAHYTAYLNHLADRLGMPDLRLPVFGREAIDKLNAAPDEPEPNTSKSQTAKRLLVPALARAGGDPAALTPAVYKDMIAAGQCSEAEVVYTEWALEVHTDEILHAKLRTAGVLDKVQAKWK